MSIPQYTGAEAAAQIFISPSLRDSRLLFVEGVCEIKLLAGIEPNWESRILSCNGHQGVKEAIEAIEEWEQRNNSRIAVIGFIDRDYGKRNKGRRLSTSNNRDVELDLYLSGAGERMLKEKASSSKCPDPRLCINSAISELRCLGILRAINSKEGLSLTFTELDIGRYCDLNGSIETRKIVRAIVQDSSKVNPDATNLQALLAKPHDLRSEDIVRGHDVSELLGKWLRKKIGNRTKAETRYQCIEENLRLASTSTDLLTYSWYRRVRQHLTK